MSFVTVRISRGFPPLIVEKSSVASRTSAGMPGSLLRSLRLIAVAPADGANASPAMRPNAIYARRVRSRARLRARICCNPAKATPHLATRAPGERRAPSLATNQVQVPCPGGEVGETNKPQ